ncbi:hypothetical protein LCI18_012741 [Fusarium solani-melongenae]|uniref:Uncharacterized protein n=1 Tax=Fusarium solani subsp. cucurbitae TaxID=2747967 RepID=A0ACD3ZL25_FUSSC|nr:hypothetical protein LCI18_012741 [Fusarium solani-melongenae]
MAEKPLLVVTGATGAQGGSVIRALAASHEASRFRIRGVCRDTEKDAAKRLASSGVEVVSAELSSEKDVRRALAGAHAVFLITAYTGNPGSREIEIQQGKLVATVSKELGVEHLIYSSLLSVTECSAGTIRTAHEFDSKAIVEQFIRQLKIPATFVLPGFYMSLFVPGDFIVRENRPPGTLRLELPLPVDEANIPLIDITDDFGKFVVAALLRREEFLGKRIMAAEAYYSMREIAATVNKFKAVHGSTCSVKQLSDDEYLRFQPSDGPSTNEKQIERLSMFRFMREFGYYQNESLEGNKRVFGHQLKSFEDFVKESEGF